MKRYTLVAFITPAVAFAEEHQHASGGGYYGSMTWFGFAELPFLLLAVVFAFLTARALRGGAFASGMNLIAWGFLVMAIGHLHMQIEHFFGISLFGTLFGPTGGAIAWLIALIVTWTLSFLGFKRIYDAAKS